MPTQCWAQGLDLVITAEGRGQPDLTGGNLKEIIFLYVESSQTSSYVWEGHEGTLRDGENILYFVQVRGNIG